MKQIDVRFSAVDIEAINKMVGRTMDKYKCDPFIFSTSVYGLVGVCIEGESYAFTNFVEVMDYFGEMEDVAIFKVAHVPFDEIHSMIQNQEMMEMPVGRIISSVSVVNEHQKLYEGDQQTYDVWLTRGIIFQFDDGHELSFEKSIWFSEEINIGKGYDLINEFSLTDEFGEGWEGEYRGECSREIILLR